MSTLSLPLVNVSLPSHAARVPRLGQPRLPGFPDLIDQLGQVAVGLGEKLPAAKLSPYGTLQELRGGKATILHRPVQVLWKVYLEPWHTPKYTPPDGWNTPPQYPGGSQTGE